MTWIIHHGKIRTGTEQIRQMNSAEKQNSVLIAARNCLGELLSALTAGSNSPVFCLAVILNRM